MTTTRRALLAALPALPASSALSGLGAFASTELSEASAPWWLLDPFYQGSSLVHGWTIIDLGPVVDGGAVITLKGPKEGPLRIHICLHDGKPKGYAHSQLFDLIVMDQGYGVREVPENLGSVLTLLSETIGDNELRTRPDIDDIAGMMTHAERVRAYGAGHLK